MVSGIEHSATDKKLHPSVFKNFHDASFPPAQLPDLIMPVKNPDTIQPPGSSLSPCHVSRRWGKSA